MMDPKSRVTGFNIYKDNHNRDVYYDRFTKEGYIINSSDVKQFNFYAKRFIVPVVVFALLYTLNIGGFEFGYLGAGVAAVFSILAMEFVFRFRFLKTLTRIPNFRPTSKENYFDQLSESASKPMLLLRTLLYVALGSLLLVYAYQQHFSTFEWIVCGIISIIAIAAGIFHLIAAFRKK